MGIVASLAASPVASAVAEDEERRELVNFRFILLISINLLWPPISYSTLKCIFTEKKSK